jgi:gliding motility-associated-like protein
MNQIKSLFVIVAILITKTSIGQVPATWTVNPAAFQYQMTVTAKLNEACVELSNTNNYLAAFVGGQCRGVVQTSVSAGLNKLALLTIKSNSVTNEQVTFKFFNAATNSVVSSADSIIFNHGTSLGTLSTPITLYTNHAPTDIAISTNTVSENSTIGTLIANLSATDQDPGTSFNYTLTSGQPENNQFSITGNQLLVNANYDFETDPIKLIEIKVDDNGGCEFIKTFTINVIDVNDPPTALTLTTIVVFDHQQAGSYTGQFFTTDQDANDVHTYSLVVGTGDTHNAEFFIQNDTLYVTNEVDFNVHPEFYIRVRSTDLGGLFIEETFTITVSNVNDAPTDILLSNNSIAENLPLANSIGTLSVIDADVGDTHTLTLVAGTGSNDNSKFLIIGNILQTNESYNFEQQDSLYIRIQATDSYSATFVKTFTIIVTDANDEPTNISLSGDSIYEQSPLNTLVGTFTSTDEDAVDTYSYSLVNGVGDTDNAIFAITANQLVSNATFTFSNQTYSVRLRTTDAGGLFFEKAFTIRVLNINDTPLDIVIDTLTIKEDNDAMFYISKIKTIDVDSPESFSYSLISGTGSEDNAEFTVSGNDLFINSKTIYDVKSQYNFRIISTDAGGLSVEKAFVLQVEDVLGNIIPLGSSNYISPNGDGKNDFWKIENVEIYKEFELKIFDQFGQVIYNVPNNYNNEFDGKYKGNPLPTGNYYYIFKNNKKEYKGNITIVN